MNPSPSRYFAAREHNPRFTQKRWWIVLDRTTGKPAPLKTTDLGEVTRVVSKETAERAAERLNQVERVTVEIVTWKWRAGFVVTVVRNRAIMEVILAEPTTVAGIRSQEIERWTVEADEVTATPIPSAV